MLDINLFLEERGGEPELIRESQRRRHESVELVDEIIALYEDWKICMSCSMFSTDPDQPRVPHSGALPPTMERLYDKKRTHG